MKAMVYHEYGSPNNLELQEADVPAVKDDEVLVQVQRSLKRCGIWAVGTPEAKLS